MRRMQIASPLLLTRPPQVLSVAHFELSDSSLHRHIVLAIVTLQQTVCHVCIKCAVRVVAGNIRIVGGDCRHRKKCHNKHKHQKCFEKAFLFCGGSNYFDNTFADQSAVPLIDARGVGIAGKQQQKTSVSYG